MWPYQSLAGQARLLAIGTWPEATGFCHTG
jgi:hypothetical protein